VCPHEFVALRDSGAWLNIGGALTDACSANALHGGNADWLSIGDPGGKKCGFAGMKKFVACSFCRKKSFAG
jgi:hypothetical protein